MDLISELIKQSEGIKETAKEIASISKKTSMIALNAAIEAARAGDAGKSFSVVADEVKKLAEEANIATEKVFTFTEVINQKTASTSLQITQQKKELEENMNTIEYALASLESISDITKMNADKVSELLKNTENLIKN